MSGHRDEWGDPLPSSQQVYGRVFLDRADPSPDPGFYTAPRLVQHLDDGAVAAVGDLYAELGLDGDVLDLASSWVSHHRSPPGRLVTLGLNLAELQANEAAAERVVHDLNADPALPFSDAEFDAVTICASIDYLVRPLEVLREAARVLRPGRLFVATFSNRCFPTKAVRGWLLADEPGRVAIVRHYVERSERFGPAVSALRTPAGSSGDPLYAVWASRA